MGRVWRRLAAGLALWLAFALAGPGAPPALASEGQPANPWHLALVVDCSQDMGAPWQGASRLALLEPLVQTELFSLPLRVRAGVWLVGGGPGQAREFLAPRPAQEFRDTNLVLPQLGGAPDLAAGLKLAADWVRQRGTGSILVISGGAGGLPAAPLAGLGLGGDGPFCHVLSLGPEEESRRQLADLALAGGGGYFQVDKADQAPPALRGAMLMALSPASLLVLTHDRDNKPLPLVYELSRRDQAASLLRGRGGRPSQLLPGVYRVAWPEGAALGPAKPPGLASVAVSGQTRLWAGGLGHLAIKALDPQGKELPWLATVANLDTGKVEVPDKRTPFDSELPAGVYRVKVVRPPLTWTVELGAGKRVELVTGPQGSLEVSLTGPSGPWRVPYSLEDQLGLRPAGTGYTNNALVVLPGRYRVQAQVVPAWSQEFSLAPGQQLRLEMPRVGGILVRRDKAGLSQTYQVLDQEERPLAGGISDRPLPVQAGHYLLQFPNQAVLLPVEVSAGRLTALDPPASASAH